VFSFNATVLEAYGMTEAAHQMSTNTLHERKPGTVGKAYNVEIAIFDENGFFLHSHFVMTQPYTLL
jgi:long-subunit acyl-CoA synthetase (AMP-forming)